MKTKNMKFVFTMVWPVVLIDIKWAPITKKRIAQTLILKREYFFITKISRFTIFFVNVYTFYGISYNWPLLLVLLFTLPFCFLFSIDGSSCKQALHNLWIYLLSMMANSVFKWNLVITRLGKPSSVEIRGTILQCTCS